MGRKARAIAEAVVKIYLNKVGESLIVHSIEPHKESADKLTELLAPERAAAKELVRECERIIKGQLALMLEFDPVTQPASDAMTNTMKSANKVLTAITEWRKIYDKQSNS